MARPTKYNPEYCKEIIDYFTNTEYYREVEIPHYKNGELSWTDKKLFPNTFPTLVQFARKIGVCYATVYNWQDKDHKSYHPEFLEAYARAKDLQKDFLIQSALTGVYDSKFSQFVAINITDMVQTQKNELSGDVRIHVVEDG